MATKKRQVAVKVQQEISAGAVFLTLIAVGVLPIIVGLYAALMATVISRSTQSGATVNVVLVTDLSVGEVVEYGEPMVLGSAVNAELNDDATASLRTTMEDEASTGVIEVVDEAPATLPFQRGDVNGDAVADVGDLSVLLDYVAYGLPIFCLDAADVNDDGRVNFLDVTYWTAWFAQGGPAPLPPGPAVVGVDPTPDELGCEVYLQ